MFVVVVGGGVVVVDHSAAVAWRASDQVLVFCLGVCVGVGVGVGACVCMSPCLCLMCRFLSLLFFVFLSFRDWQELFVI